VIDYLLKQVDYSRN